MKKKIFKWSVIGLISILSFSGISGGVIAFCLTNLQKPIYEGELFKSISLIDSDEYLPTEYEIPQTANYDNAYFQNLGFEITNNVNVESFGIKKVYLNKMNDDIGSAKLIIEFYKYKNLEIKVDNFLDKARWLDIDLNINKLINNSTVSYLYKNKELLTNQLKLNDAFVSLSQVKYEIKNYDDKQALLILKCSTDTKKRSIRLRTKVDSDTLLKAIVDTSKVSNTPTNLTPSLFHKRYSTIDKIFDLSSLKYFYDSELLTCNPYINDPSRSLIYKLSYNGQTFDYVIEGLYSDYEFNQYTLFNKIKYMTPYDIKFNNYKSLYEPNLSTNLNNLETLGFFDIDKNMNLNNLKISYLNDENKFVLTYSVDNQVFQREFDVQVFEFDNHKIAIDANLITLLNDFSKIDPKKMELKSDKNFSYEEIRNEIDTIFNDVFLTDIDKTFNNQISTLMYNLVTEFVTFNTFRRVSDNQGDMHNYLLLLLNSFQLKYESQKVDQQLVFDIQLTIYNHESLNLGELVFPYKETKESETTKNLIIRNNEKLLLNWTNTDLIDGKLNLEPIRTEENVLDAAFNQYIFSIFYFSNTLNRKTDAQKGLEIASDVFSFMSLIAAIPGLKFTPLGIASLAFSAVQVVLDLTSYIVGFFTPSETAIKYSRPLDLSYFVEDPIWDVYVNGMQISKDENVIIKSFSDEIEKQHKSTISLKGEVYNLIENIIKYDNSEDRTTNFLINNNEDFIKSLINLFSIFSNKINDTLFYSIFLLLKINDSNGSTIIKNLNEAIGVIINNEISKILIDNSNILELSILKSINSLLIQEILRFDYSERSFLSLKNKIKNIDQYINSKEFIDSINYYITIFFPNSSVDLNNLINSIKIKWLEIKSIYENLVVELHTIYDLYLSKDFNTILFRKVIQFNMISKIAKIIIDSYDKNELSRQYFLQIIATFGLKPNMIFPIFRIISSLFEKENNLTDFDILQIVCRYIKFYKVNWEKMYIKDDKKFSYESCGNPFSFIFNYREIDTGHSIGHPYAHIFRHSSFEVWQVQKLFQFYLTDITDKFGKKYSMSELLKSLNWSYSISANYVLDEKKQRLKISNLNFRSIILEKNDNFYSLNSQYFLDIFNKDYRNPDSSIFVVYEWKPWNKGNKTIRMSSSTNLQFINSRQEYLYTNLERYNAEFINYEIDNGNIKWDNFEFIFGIPSIKESLIDYTTNNLFGNIQLFSSIGVYKPYFINFMKDFIRGFYLLSYDTYK